MTTITTVRAALQGIATQGVCHRSLYQLGAAMGPATLYVPGAAGAAGFEPLLRTDATGRTWLQAWTAPHPRHLLAGDRVSAGAGGVVSADAPLDYRAMTGAALLRLACERGFGLVLDGASPLEFRIPARGTQSLHVAAGYTEALVTGVRAPADRQAPGSPTGSERRAAPGGRTAPGTRPATARRTRPRFDAERLAS